MIQTLQCGAARIDLLDAGKIRYDGGVSFGAFPREVWSTFAPSDEMGRITLGLRPVLVRTNGKTLLVDAGLGDHRNEKWKERYAFEGKGSLAASLEDAGVGPNDVDYVIFTHLHVDHLGGALDGKGTIFPNASFLVQKGEWEAAHNTNMLTRGAYSPTDLKLLEASGDVVKIEGDAEPLPGVRLAVTGGHTAHHQIVLVESDGVTILLPGDLLPSSNHFRLPCIAAVDLNRQESFLQKASWMKRASEENWMIALYHEAEIGGGWIAAPSRNRYELERAGEGGKRLDS